MTAIARCLCGAVRLTLPQMPARATDCNCSVCRRLGALWAYFPAESVAVSGATLTWQRPAEPMLAFHRCATCGCATHWTGLRPPALGRVGVNARMIDGFDPWTATLDRIDGANDAWPA